MGSTEVRNTFKTWSNLNPALSNIYNRKMEISKEKKDSKVKIGLAIDSPD